MSTAAKLPFVHLNPEAEAEMPNGRYSEDVYYRGQLLLELCDQQVFSIKNRFSLMLMDEHLNLIDSIIEKYNEIGRLESRIEFIHQFAGRVIYLTFSRHPSLSQDDMREWVNKNVIGNSTEETESVTA